ncbi:DUF4363 family protein [Herbivorax sp. ANBcel31]|uniref:DUF4363 family protein n=1 Tax=Herbivorax sp. ANBcel31 TaxID=3069754 RepID=UPI0027B3F17A|nr:DUF4363 family protein [Herbivorax sp. ANBcel31]MDQ2085715.1 DUF4363 family protein [Herbivorax sp. ANBcel31]
MHTFKVLGGLALVLALIIGSSFFSSRTLSASSQRIEEKILEVETNTYKNNWDLASNSLSIIIEEWPETEKSWSILLDHSDIDDISTSIFRLSRYLEAEDSTQTLAEIAALKQLLKTIPDREVLSLSNIF